jgi:hypothetical protein
MDPVALHGMYPEAYEVPTDALQVKGARDLNQALTANHIRSRVFKLPFEKLNRAAGCVVPGSCPPPCNTNMIGARMETLLSVIGLDLVRFDSCPRRVDEFARFLGKLMGRPPGREERLAAATGDMTMQVVWTYTQMPLRPLVEWFLEVWVPQERRLIADDEARSDLVGRVLCDAFLCRNVDPITNGNNLPYANVMRTHFFPSTDPAWLCGDDYHVFHIPLLVHIIERTTHREYNKNDVVKAIKQLFVDTEDKEHLRLRVRLLDYKRKCLSDLYRDNGGELPHESKLEDYLGDNKDEVYAISARVVQEKVGHSAASPTSEPDHTTTITNFTGMIETDGYYPFERPEVDWACTPQDVDEAVEDYGHTRAIGLADADFAPLSDTVASSVTSDTIEGHPHTDEELEEETSDNEFDFRIPESPPSSQRSTKRASPGLPEVLRNRRRRSIVLESPEQSQLPSGTFDGLEDLVPDVLLGNSPSLDQRI